MATYLVFARETTLEGLVYPPGAIVPAGALTLTRLRSLRDSNRIIEVREEDLKAIVYPHRPNQLDPRLLMEAEARVAQKKQELALAQEYYDSILAIREEDERPIEEYEPERRGVEVDLEDMAATKVAVVQEEQAPVEEPTEAEKASEEDPFGDELLAPKPSRKRSKKVLEEEAEVAELEVEDALPEHLDDNAV